MMHNARYHTGDVLCVLLGCDSPVFLRELKPDQFIVVGECFVHSLHDATSLLGPASALWLAQTIPRLGERLAILFRNEETSEVTSEDPRLGPLGDWERILDHEPEADDPDVYEYFRHKHTKEVMNSDPRMLPDTLRARGVELRTFALI